MSVTDNEIQQLREDGKGNVADFVLAQRARIAELEAQRKDAVVVDRGVLRMVLNALRRDAEEGKAARGERADELESAARINLLLRSD